MPYVNLENENLKILISSKGAELQSLFNKKNSTEYLWQGDPAFWSRRAPHLFPIIGGLKEGRFVYDTQTYPMGNHGFARDSEFSIEYPSLKKVTFTLNEKKENYPFNYEFQVIYKLKRNQLKITYRVLNRDSKRMFFSVGGHPAFNCPIDKELKYTDYFIEFEREEENQLLLIEDDLVKGIRRIPLQGKKLPLIHTLFQQDALVFDQPLSKKFSLRSDKDSKQVEMSIKNFDLMAFWAKDNPDSHFVCFEPWCGIDDKADTDQQLEHKWKILSLKPKKSFKCSYTITIS